MKPRGWMIGLLMACAVAPPALAQADLDAVKNEQYVPRLADIMNGLQSRHNKLWFAGKALNWELAAYELRLIKGGLLEAAVLYPGIPVSNVTTMTRPVQAVADAIEARDSKRFSKAAGELTEGCNACHQSMGRGFIVMRLPGGEPSGNQSFAPRGRP